MLFYFFLKKIHMISINLDNALIITQGLINHLTIKELPRGGGGGEQQRKDVMWLENK